MKQIFTILLLTLFASLAFSQPELVSDFNPGTEDGFSEWYYTGESFQDKIFLPALSPDTGLELAMISNGEISIIKDINEGPDESRPRSFTLYKDDLYFVADDGVNGEAIWKTDGTEAGTVMVVDPGTANSTPRSLIVAENGWLYYGYSGSVYRTDGTTNEEVFQDGSLSFISSSASYNYCAYKNGIALLNKNNDYSFSLIHIDDAEGVELARTEETDFHADGFGLATVSNGLIFSIYDSDVDAMHVYDEGSQTISKLPLGSEDIPSRRTINFTDEVNICWFASKGYYGVNGISGEQELLFETENSSATQGEILSHGIYEDKVVFIPNDGFFGDEYLLHSDGTTAGTTNLGVLESYQSEMLLFKNFAIFADGTSNGFEPTLYKVNIESGTVETVHEFVESSNNIDSVRPLGVQDDYLYYLSNLDPEVGLELYRIKLDLMLNTEDEVLEEDFDLTQAGDLFTINMEQQKNIKVNIFNALGQNLYQNNVQSNQAFKVNLESGSYYMNVSSENMSSTKLVYIYR